MAEDLYQTQKISSADITSLADLNEKADVREVLTQVYTALNEKGYNPVNQIVGYLLSGDPTYVTGYKNARNLIGRIERDELLEEILNFYLNGDR